MVAQLAGALIGVIATHLMFDMSLFQVATNVRSSFGLWSAELIATFGLVATIFLTLHANAQSIPTMVGLYVAAGIWFTASTCFANPAVTIARGFTNTFTGIRPFDMPPFIIAQFLGGVLAVLAVRALTKAVHGSTSNVPHNEPVG